MGRGSSSGGLQVVPRRGQREWQAENGPGMPRPLFAHPVLGMKPVPWTTEVRKGEPSFAEADGGRLAACWTESLCALCGEGLEEQVFAVVYKERPPDGIGNPGRIIDGAFHRRCAKVTAAHCPPLRKGLDEERFRLVSFSFTTWEALRAERMELDDPLDSPDGGFAPIPDGLFEVHLPAR